MAVFDELLSKIFSVIPYDGGDTGFLNAYFNDWYERDHLYRLPYTYNA